MNLHHIFHTRARFIHEKSVVYLNEAMLTVIFEFVSGSYLKLLVLTTYDGSDSFETVSPGSVNDLHDVVLNFLKSYSIQIAMLMLYMF